MWINCVFSWTHHDEWTCSGPARDKNLHSDWLLRAGFKLQQARFSATTLSKTCAYTSSKCRKNTGVLRKKYADLKPECKSNGLSCYSVFLLSLGPVSRMLTVFFSTAYTHFQNVASFFFWNFTHKSNNCTHNMQNASHLLQNEALHSKCHKHL